MKVNDAMTELDCKDIKALLSGLIDGELDDTKRHQAERHLADCKPCRDTVSEAETLNNLLVMEAQHSAAKLPASFENAVLRQTVYAEAYAFAGRRWTSWLGWVAAAACLGLATSMWFVNRQLTTYPDQIARAPGSNDNSTSRTSAYTPGLGGKSWTYPGSLPAELISGSNSREFSATGEAYRAVDEQLASIMPVRLTNQSSRSVTSSPQTDLGTEEDAHALSTASNLLDMLSRADVKSFADVEYIRQIAVYDDLLNRLTDSRSRLQMADRPAVMAAESILLRVVNGPLSEEDLQLLRESAKSLDLSRQLQSINDRWQPASSL